MAAASAWNRSNAARYDLESARLRVAERLAGIAGAPLGLFAIGDVHGCAAELGALLDSIAGLAGEAKGRRRLIYLGDMINRGPDSAGVLELWARGEEAHG